MKKLIAAFSIYLIGMSLFNASFVQCMEKSKKSKKSQMFFWRKNRDNNQPKSMCLNIIYLEDTTRPNVILSKEEYTQFALEAEQYNQNHLFFSLPKELLMPFFADLCIEFCRVRYFDCWNRYSREKTFAHMHNSLVTWKLVCKKMNDLVTNKVSENLEKYLHKIIQESRSVRGNEWY
jgi:hypothetical protein